MMIEIAPPLTSRSNPRVDKKLPEILAITGGKERIGKTFLSISLAFFLRQYQPKVLLVDADSRSGNIEQLLHLQPPCSLMEAINENLDLHPIMLKAPGDIKVLSSHLTGWGMLEPDDYFLKKLHFAFSRYEREYNTIIVDAGTGDSRNALANALSADKIIIIVTPDPDSITEAYSLIKIITGIDPTRSLILIPNMMTSKDEGRLLYHKLKLMVTEFLNVELIWGGTISRYQQAAESRSKLPEFWLNNPDPELAAEMHTVARCLMNLPAGPAKNSPGYFNRVITNRKIIPRIQYE